MGSMSLGAAVASPAPAHPCRRCRPAPPPQGATERPGRGTSRPDGGDAEAGLPAPSWVQGRGVVTVIRLPTAGAAGTTEVMTAGRVFTAPAAKEAPVGDAARCTTRTTVGETARPAAVPPVGEGRGSAVYTLVTIGAGCTLAGSSEVARAEREAWVGAAIATGPTSCCAEDLGDCGGASTPALAQAPAATWLPAAAGCAAGVTELA